MALPLSISAQLCSSNFRYFVPSNQYRMSPPQSWRGFQPFLARSPLACLKVTPVATLRITISLAVWSNYRKQENAYFSVSRTNRGRAYEGTPFFLSFLYKVDINSVSAAGDSSVIPAAPAWPSYLVETISNAISSRGENKTATIHTHPASHHTPQRHVYPQSGKYGPESLPR